MNNVQLFSSPKFGDIRIVEIEGKPYFVAIDVARGLGYKDPNSAVTRHCKGAVKHPVLDNNRVTQIMNVIPQGDIYRLAAKSELPGAEEFESWIFDDVLVSVVNHGAYMTGDTLEKALTSPDFLIQLATNLKEEQQKRITAERIIEEQAPKVQFADSFKASSSLMLIRDLAKYINQNACPMGETRLYNWLVEHKYLIRSKRWSNTKQKYEFDYTPTQKASDLKIFHVEPTLIHSRTGEYLFTKHTVKANAKGQEYFLSKFLKDKVA